MAQDLSQRRQDRRVAVGIFFLALAVYLVTFLGAPKSPDERALFSGIDSLVKRGDFQVNQIYWDYSNVAMETTEGEMVPNYEPAQMILAIPFYLWGRSLGAALQGVMAFNAVVTAASVALLYLCFIELGYRRRTATLGALVYAFATLAWPYSRVFFREPLTVLAYLVAVYALLRYRPPAPRRLLWPALAGAAAGLAFVTKQISVAAFPALLLLALACEWRRPADAGSTRSLGQTRLRALLAAALPLAGIVLLGQLYQWTTLSGIETFARNIVDYTTNPQLSSSLPERMLRGGLGLTISPFRGIFWYSPVLLLGLIGALPFTRRHRWEGIAFLLLVAAHILGYSRYLYWSGGVAWGARYMLPIIPFLLLLAAPVFAWLIKDQAPPSTSELYQNTSSGLRVTHYALRITTWLLIAWSSFVALLGILFDWRAYELPFLLEQAKVWGGIGEAIDATYMNIAVSPVVGHIRLLLTGGAPLDLAWMQQRGMGASAFVPQGLLLSLGLMALALAALVWIWRQPQRAGLAALLMTAASVIAASLLLVIYRQGDARFDAYDVDRFLKPIMARLEEVPCGWQGCDQVALVNDPALTDYFLNYLAAPLVWYGIDYAPVNQRLMERLAGRYGRIWLIRDRSAAADDAEGRRAVERWLVEHTFKLDEQQIDDWARLVQFSAAGLPVEVAEPGQALGDLTLARAELAIEQQPAAGRQPAAEPLDDGQVQARAGDVLQLSLHWLAGQTPQGNYTVFVQLLDEAGQVVAQKDRWPGDGLFPTATMQPGQTITDNLAIPLDLPPRPLSPDRRPLPGRCGGLPASQWPRRRFRRAARHPGAAMNSDQLPVTSDQVSVNSKQLPIIGHLVTLSPCHPVSGLALALLLTLPALLPLLQAGFFISDDGLFHVYRTAALAEAWGQGVLWPRLFPDFGFGYGQAVLNFYAPLSYVPGALLSVLGMNPATAVQVVIGLSFLLAAAAAFGYGNFLFGPAGGVLAAVVYTYTPYHLADAYLRGAVPEHMAFIFPPLILWAFTAVFWPGRRLPSFGKDGNLVWPPLLWGSLAWAGLVLTHNLTALLLMPVALLHLGMLAAWTGRWRRLADAAGALALAAGLSAFFWLPALVESRAVGLSVGASAGYANHMLTGATWLRRSLAFFLNPPETLGPLFPLSWFALALVAVGTILLLRAALRLASFGKDANLVAPPLPLLAFHLAVAIGAMFMTTAASLFIWRPLTAILGQLQYPWRFLLLEAVGLMGVAAALPTLLPRGSRVDRAGALIIPRSAWVVAVVTLLAMLAALPGLRVESLPVSQADARLPGRMWAEDAAAGQVGATWTGEFLPLTVTEQRWALGRGREGATDGAALSPTPAVTLTRLGYGSWTAQVETAAPLSLRLHQFDQSGWRAMVDGQPAAVYPTGELGLATVDLPAGRHEVTIAFGMTPARVAGLLLTLLAATLWITLALARGRSRALKATGVALGIVAAALALNSLGLGQRTWTPQPVQATLEDVAVLLAADARVISAGSGLGQETGPSATRQAEVTLHWLALREMGQNYRAFVHLLGPDGAVIAQHDGDPVGGYTPTTRWRPGEIIADRHLIPLPEGLPAGEYSLRAGLYQVEPLRNLTVNPPTADNRVDVGTLSVTSDE